MPTFFEVYVWGYYLTTSKFFVIKIYHKVSYQNKINLEDSTGKNKKNRSEVQKHKTRNTKSEYLKIKKIRTLICLQIWFMQGQTWIPNKIKCTKMSLKKIEFFWQHHGWGKKLITSYRYVLLNLSYYLSFIRFHLSFRM